MKLIIMPNLITEYTTKILKMRKRKRKKKRKPRKMVLLKTVLTKMMIMV